MAAVLIVDDDEEIRKVVDIYLKNEGLEVFQAQDGEAALKIVSEQKLDLILLDIMMPGMDGIRTCRMIRELSMVPIIFLSAKSEEIDKIHGLATGADDYISKPFNAMELIARVKAQIRRYTRYSVPVEQNNPHLIEIGEMTVNTDTRLVTVSGREVRLTPKEFDILELLAANRGIVFSIEKIYERVWNEQFFRSDNTVMVHITKIRDKIEEDPKKPIYIKTIWGVGYKI